MQEFSGIQELSGQAGLSGHSDERERVEFVWHKA